MTRAFDLAYRFLDALVVLILAGMVALVFANAVARYAFDYSIHVADELPRFLFVWHINKKEPRDRFSRPCQSTLSVIANQYITVLYRASISRHYYSGTSMRPQSL